MNKNKRSRFAQLVARNEAALLATGRFTQERIDRCKNPDLRVIPATVMAVVGALELFPQINRYL